MDFDINDIFQTRMKKGLGDFHLRSAITKVNISELKMGVGRWREVKAWRRFPKNVGEIKSGDSGQILAKMFKNLPTQTHTVYQEELIGLLQREVVNLNWLSHEGDPCSKVIQVLKSCNIGSIYGNVKEILQIGLIYNNAISSGRTFNHPNLKEMFGTKQVITCATQFSLFGDLVLVYQDDEYSAISLDGYRMIVDKATERDNILSASTIGFEVFPEVYPPHDLIQTIFSLFDSYLSLVGNIGYKTLKTFEAVVTGVIISKTQAFHYDKDSFLKSTLDGLDTTEGINAMRSLVDILEPISNIHHLTQIMGLFRSWGHPIIDSKEGVRKVRTIAKKKKIIHTRTAKIAGWQFLETFFIQYFQRKGIYPPFTLEVNSDPGIYLIKTLLAGEIINLRSPEYLLSDWDQIICGQVFQTPLTFNLSMIVADTAISPTRSELFEVQQGKRKMMDADIRRGVISWMKKGVLNCKDLLSSINDHPTGLDKEHLAIGEYPKEREMNPTARMFALMTMLMRSYVVITENMISENIIPYIPGITMTYSLLDLSKEMVKNTAHLKDGGKYSKTFCINMDFEKWNLNMRKEATYNVFLNLGRLFGLPHLYNRTYDMFENSIIYLADGSYNPTLSEDYELTETDPDLAYTGHKGGFEGLRQKGWTVFTVVLITYVCNLLGIKYKLMGQGDNQVLIVEIFSRLARSHGIDSQPAIDEIAKSLTALVDKLEEVFQDVGLPLKKLETWISDSFFSYGKFPIYKGLPCSTSLKRIARIFFFSNEDLMTLDNALGAITANAQAGVMHDVHPIICYVMARWQQLLCVGLFQKYHPLMGESPVSEDASINWTFKDRLGVRYNHAAKYRLSADIERHLMVSIPKTLGGFNVINYFDVIMRGFSDPVNKDMQWMYHLRDNSSGLFAQAIDNLIRPYYSPTIDYLHLIQDPTSINILTPPNSTTVIKRMIHKTIDSISTNSEFSLWFKEVLNLGKENEVRAITDKLTSGEYLNVRLFHDILGSTLFGYADSITSKVDKTVTLSRMTLGKENVVLALIKGEARFWKYFLWRITVPGEGTPHQCPSSWVREIRNLGWKKIIQTVSTPFPYHFMTTCCNETDRQDSYIEGFVSDLVLGRQSMFLKTGGSSLPYLGSVTKEKIGTSSAKAAFGTEPLITRPLRLMRAIGWFVDEDSNVAKSIIKVLEAVTDLDPADILYIPDHVKGSMAHRYSDYATKHGSLWMSLFGPPSHLSVSTNTFLEYAKGTKNVTLHFQALLCMIQFALINKNLSLISRKYTRFYRGCSECITPIDDVLEDLQEALTTEDIPSSITNPYLYIKKEDISLVYRLAIWEQSIIPIVPLDSIPSHQLGLAILEHVALKQALKILYGGDKDSGDITDLTGIPRTAFLKLSIKQFFEKLTVFLLMGVAQGLDPNIYPSYNYLKGKILKRVQTSSTINFNVIAGWFYWDEGIDEIKRFKWGVLPLSYPITPYSACQASKLMITKYISSITPGAMRWSGVLLPGILNSLEFTLKANMIWKKGGAVRTSCLSCQALIMTSRISPAKVQEELLKLKCKEGHNPIHSTLLRSLIRNDEIMDAVLDLIPKSESIQNSMDAMRYMGRHKFVQRPSLLASRMTHGFFDGIIDCLHFKPPCNTINEVELEMPYGLPTKAGYKLFDVLEMLPEITRQSYIILGDGYGYTSTVTKLFNPKSTVIGWTLIDVVSSIQHCLNLAKPPVHFYSSLQVQTSPTLYKISDISNPGFDEDFKQEVLKNGSNVLISDVEPWYVGAPDTYFDIINCAYKSRINSILIHLKFLDGRGLLEVLGSIIQKYHEWKILCPISCHLDDGEFWVYMTGRRKTEIPISTPNYESQQSLLRMIHQRRYQPPIDMIARWKYLNTCLAKIGVNKLLENLCTEWFNLAGLGYWCEKDYTQMYYLLKTGRRPRNIVDNTGNQAYYLHSEHSDQLKIRLLTLVLAELNNVYSVVPILQQNWRLGWKKDKSLQSSTLRQQWSPFLRREDGTMSKESQGEILKYLPAVRYLRSEKGVLYQDFSDVPAEIFFKAQTRKKDRNYGESSDNSSHVTNLAYLRITKQASFSAPDN